MLYRIQHNVLIFLFTLLVSVAVSDIKFAKAASRNAGNGRVSMQGSIIDAPCAIAPSSQYQLVEFTALPLSQLIREGQTEKQHFSVDLVNCDLTPTQPNRADRPWTKFSMTFDADALSPHIIKLSGETKGIGLQIEDDEGNILSVGKSISIKKLDANGLTLNYMLSFVVYPGEHLNVGKFSSTIRFKFEYF